MGAAGGVTGGLYRARGRYRFCVYVLLISALAGGVGLLVGGAGDLPEGHWLRGIGLVAIGAYLLSFLLGLGRQILAVEMTADGFALHTPLGVRRFAWEDLLAVWEPEEGVIHREVRPAGEPAPLLGRVMATLGPQWADEASQVVVVQAGRPRTYWLGWDLPELERLAPGPDEPSLAGQL